MLKMLLLTQMLVLLSIQSICNAVPAKTNIRAFLKAQKETPTQPGKPSASHKTDHEASTSSSSQLDNDYEHSEVIAPLSHYRATRWYGGKRLQNPQWDKYSFHMINDHPINAAKHRQRLDSDLKEGIIDKHLHGRESAHSKAREAAVTHVLQGGLVWDDETLIHGDYFEDDPEKIKEILNKARFAHFDTRKTRGSNPRVIKQSFAFSTKHADHAAEEATLHQDLIREKDALRAAVNVGKHQDRRGWKPPHNVRYRRKSTPPPGSRSPSPPPSPSHKRVRTGIFSNDVWQ
jgi:hypothetical protein